MHGYRAEFDKALPLGYELLELADAQDSETMRVDAHLMVGVGPRVHQRHRRRPASISRTASSASSRSATARIASRSEPNPGIACYTTAGLIWWLRGFPDRALERANRAVTLAMELRHPFTMAYALYHTGFLHLLRQEPEPLRERASACWTSRTSTSCRSGGRWEP